MSIESTRLRAVTSKELDALLAWVNTLGFKIEIKGAPMKVDKQWKLFFVLPDIENPAFKEFPLVMEL